MKNFLFFLIALLNGANCSLIFAQQKAINGSDSLSSEMKKIAKPESICNWIKFKDSMNINPTTIFTQFKAAFDLRENDKMILVEVDKDDLGFTHYHYQQYYKDIKIDVGTYTVRTNKNGITYAANGKILTGISLNTVPLLTSDRAVQSALKYVNSKEYTWQSEFWEKDLKERTKKSDTSYYPKPQLVIREVMNKAQKPNQESRYYFLVYLLDIYSASPNYAQRVFVDANTGEILYKFPLQSN